MHIEHLTNFTMTMLQDSTEPYKLHVGFRDLTPHVGVLAKVLAVTEKEGCLEMLHNSGHLDLETQCWSPCTKPGFDFTLIMSDAKHALVWLAMDHACD